ncbi:hypothetical protein EDD22DRAFT_1025340 [Suillus occidentalis]|nr:hypothetical protein EDD22DRAFT_1025340 [Suillus occidentalis]
MILFLLDIIEVAESHTGKAMARAFQAMLEQFGLTQKILALNADNAAANDTQTKHLVKKVDPEEPKDKQLDKTTPEPPAPSSADKQSGGIPPEGPKESKKEVKQSSKPHRALNSS